MPPNRFRTGYVASIEDGVKLGFSLRRSHRWRLTYSPAAEALRIAKQADADFTAPATPILLVEGDPRNDLLVTHPLNTTATSSGFLEPKHGRLRTITFEGFGLSDCNSAEAVTERLQDLPSGFVKDPVFGLGLRWELRYLVYFLTKLPNILNLRLRQGRSVTPPTIEGSSYVWSESAFHDARKAIKRAHDKALDIADDEKSAFAHNSILTALDPARFPAEQRPYRKNAVAEAIGNALNRSTVLSPRDREAVLAATSSAARTIARNKPEPLLELSHEIEVLTLEGLLARLRSLLERGARENDWQQFFLENPFVLRLAFSLPIMMIGGQVSVGGRRFDGTGDKISDFAVRAAISGNLSLVEIKTSETPVIERAPYREGIFAPSRELMGAVNQVLDQRYQLQKSITILKDNSQIEGIESYAIQCLVIAGKAPEEKSQLKSFELIRNSLKSVTIVTFDELVRKLEHLLEVLSEAKARPGEKPEDKPEEEEERDLEEEPE